MNRIFAIALVAGIGGPEQKRLDVPKYLSPIARDLLAQKMEQHGLDMMRLVGDVVMLAYNDTELVANQIADQPGLARPTATMSDALNASLPKPYFELQDQLRVHARALANAAKRKQEIEMGTAFGRMTQTCVACHSLYLKGALAEERRFDKGQDVRPSRDGSR